MDASDSRAFPQNIRLRQSSVAKNSPVTSSEAPQSSPCDLFLLIVDGRAVSPSSFSNHSPSASRSPSAPPSSAAARSWWTRSGRTNLDQTAGGGRPQEEGHTDRGGEGRGGERGGNYCPIACPMWTKRKRTFAPIFTKFESVCGV